MTSGPLPSPGERRGGGRRGQARRNDLFGRGSSASRIEVLPSFEDLMAPSIHIPPIRHATTHLLALPPGFPTASPTSTTEPAATHLPAHVKSWSSSLFTLLRATRALATFPTKAISVLPQSGSKEVS